jgi:hypothetical protein
MAHHGAVAFWDKVVHKATGTGTDPNEYHWIEATHDRDYRDYEVANSGARWFFQPTGAAGAFPNSIVDGPTHSVDKPTGVTVNEGYLHDTNSHSPLAKRRANDEGKEPDRAAVTDALIPTTPHTCQTSVDTVESLSVIPAVYRQLQGTPYTDGALGFLNPVRATGDYPFTLEGWVKDATDGMVLGVSPWLDPSNTGTSNLPAAAWRFVGVGFEDGIPIALWGGFGGLYDPADNTPDDYDLYHAYPDVNLTRGTDGTPWSYNTGASSQTLTYAAADDGLWHHLVLVVHAEDHIQLFYDGRCVLNAKEEFWHENKGMVGGTSATHVPFEGLHQDRTIFKFSEFSAPHKFAMQIGGITHTYESGGIDNFNAIHQLKNAAGSDGASVAACATYPRALTDEEVMDHYVTMTQAFTIKLLGDNDLTIAAHGDGVGEGDPHPSGYWVGQQGIREVIQPNTWGSGSSDMFGMFHDRLWRDASQPAMEFLYKPGQAALVHSPLTNTLELTQVETWSEVSDHRTDWRAAGDGGDWSHSRGWGMMICAAPVGVSASTTPEGGPAYPYANTPAIWIPSWVGDDAAAQPGWSNTWEYKLFDSFGDSLDENAGTNEGTGGLLRIGKDAAGSTIHNYWLFGQTGDHGGGVSVNSGYEGEVRVIYKIEDRRFGVFATAIGPPKIYGQADLGATTSVSYAGVNYAHGSVRSEDLSDEELSHPLRLFQAADGVDYAADTDTNARGCQEPLIRLGMAAYFRHGMLPTDAGGNIDGTQELALSTLERAIRGHAPARSRMTTQAPRRWFQLTRMALPRNTRTRLRESQP